MTRSDRCGTGCRRQALVWWVRDTDTEPHPDTHGWQMCGPCSARHQGALQAGGHEVWVDEREGATT